MSFMPVSKIDLFMPYAMSMSFRVSTYVIVGEVNSTFDIDTIYNNIGITGEIAKVRYNNKEKTAEDETDCKTFFNQISIYMKTGLCVKMFSNGKFQISGAKSEEQAHKTIAGLIENIKAIIGEKRVEYQNEKGLPVYNGKVLIKDNDHKYTATFTYKKREIHVLDSVFLHCEHTGLLIEKFHVDRTKRILDMNLEHVGYAKFMMKRRGKNLCLKHLSFKKTSTDNYLIYNEKYNVDYGTLIYEWFKEPFRGLPKGDVILKYRAVDPDTRIISTRIANLNSSIRLDIGKKTIDRTCVYDKLVEMGITVDYNPAKFPGIKFTHDDTKITIFRTGSIILASTSHPQGAIDFITELFEEDFTVDKSGLQVDTSRVLTIWDLFD